MPDSRISELPPATTLQDSDFAPMVQGVGVGVETRRATFAQLRTTIQAERALHVREFGAVGNGTTDDAASIQAAINAASAAGGGTVLLGPRRYLVDGSDIIVPQGVTLAGGADPCGFRVNNDYTAVPHCIVLNPARTIRLRRNATLERVAIIRKGFAAPSSVRTALDAVAAFSGTAVSVGDGSTGASATSGTDATIRKLLIVGFTWGIRSDGSSRTRILDVLGDCTNGLYLGKSYDIAHNERINWHPIGTAGRLFSSTTYAVTGCANNGSGLVRLSFSAAHELQAGDLLIIRAVGGVPGANGRFAVAAVPSGTQVDLAGSVFSGAYTSGGLADPGVSYRRGKAFHVYDADMPNFVNCFEFGHETGWHLDDLCHAVQLTNCGVDGSGRDPNSVGVRITGLSNRNKWYGGFWSDKGTALIVDSTALDHNTIAGVMLTNGNGRSVQVDDGALILVGCDVYGQVYLGDNADSVQLVGCDAKSASFAGQSATALGRLLVIGSRLAAGAGVARLAGGQAELAAVSSGGTIDTRLSARGDGTVAIHRRNATQGAQIRLNDSTDAVSATLGLANDDVVIETRVAGTIAERFRLAASGAVTLSGPLTLPGDPTVSTQAATKAYVDANASATSRVAKAGDTMTGALTLPGDPTATLQAATKGYVDTVASARVAKAGDTLTGALTLSADPTATLHAATKGYVDMAVTARVTRTGDTMTGALTLPGDPTAALHASTKGYVDTAASARVAKAGDAMTGALTLPGDPTAALHAATKGYVDTQFTARALTTAAISGATALTGAAHNARMVIANTGATLSADWAATGHGFSCMVVNRTGADLPVTLTNFSGAIANADGNTKIKAGGIASLIAYSPDGGTTKVMHLAGAGAP